MNNNDNGNDNNDKSINNNDNDNNRITSLILVNSVFLYHASTYLKQCFLPLKLVICSIGTNT